MTESMESTNCGQMEWGVMFSLAQYMFELRKGQRLDIFHLQVS